MTDLNQNAPKSWDRPEGASFEEWCNTRIARYSTRKYDWNALKFQADYDPRFRRAQMRYIGTGGTGVASDMNTIPSEHFTFSTMVIPAVTKARRTCTSTSRKCSSSCAASSRWCWRRTASASRPSSPTAT